MHATCRTSSKRRVVGLFVATLLTWSVPALHAHDAWIEPTEFHPASGAIVGARLRVGQNLIGDPLPRDGARIREFVVEDDSGRRPLVGHDGEDPAGAFRVATPGLLVIGYHSHPSVVTEASQQFERYLAEEGLEAIAAERGRSSTEGNVRERFSRCAKSLVLSGPVGADQVDRALGFTLELVAERNPYGMSVGEALPVRLTYQGRPLAGALVVAMNRDDPTGKLAARSDSDGRVRFALPRGGFWLVKAVHMIPAPADADADAEWQSYWASLTFDLPARAPEVAHEPG